MDEKKKLVLMMIVTAVLVGTVGYLMWRQLGPKPTRVTVVGEMRDAPTGK